MSLRELEPLTKMMDDGISKVVAEEISEYNQGTVSRYPLSPSGIGKCALKLARDLSHFHGLKSYPRATLPTRLHRVFSRGHKLEEALVEDFEKYTDLQLKLKQQRVHLFNVSHGDRVVPIDGDIDGLIVCRRPGFRILVDFKSKGAFYSAGFTDSIAQFFEEMKETRLVEDMGHNCYLVPDIEALFNGISADDFFSDYILQLNSYAFSDWFSARKIDGVALYYENKNTCAHYEVRWVPSENLFSYAKNKFQHIFETTFSKGAEAVEPEFGLGSTKCRLCDYNELCHGKFEKKDKRIVGEIPEKLEQAFVDGIKAKMLLAKEEEKILLEMERLGLTHFRTRDGLTYERKFLKTPKPHYELRLSR